MGKIAHRQSLAFNERSQLSQACLCSMWNKYYTNERQSRDSNRSATNAGSTRTEFCAFGVKYDRQRTLVIRIAAITLASDSAMTRLFHADFGKEFPSRTLWRGPSQSRPSPCSALCPLLYRTEHFSREKRAKRCREKGRTRGGQQRGQKGKKDA